MSVDHKNELKKIIKKDNRKSAEQIKDQFNEITDLQVSTKTIRRSLHDLNINSRVAVTKVVREINKLMINIKDFSLQK